jgi:hypothetical protein
MRGGPDLQHGLPGFRCCRRYQVEDQDRHARCPLTVPVLGTLSSPRRRERAGRCPAVGRSVRKDCTASHAPVPPPRPAPTGPRPASSRSWRPGTDRPIVATQPESHHAKARRPTHKTHGRPEPDGLAAHPSPSQTRSDTAMPRVGPYVIGPPPRRLDPQRRGAGRFRTNPAKTTSCAQTSPVKWIAKSRSPATATTHRAGALSTAGGGSRNRTTGPVTSKTGVSEGRPHPVPSCSPGPSATARRSDAGIEGDPTPGAPRGARR